MRTLICPILAMSLVALAILGCEPKKEYPGPTVNAFTGKLVHNGKSVSFSEKEKVQLKLMYEKGESFGIPIKPDGTFQIGWMPIGKYSAILQRTDVPGAKGSAPVMYSVPGGLKIEEGKTEYEVELGKNWKQ